MPGSTTAADVPPRPFELAVRALVAGALVLWLAHAFERPIVEAGLPAIGAAVSFFDEHFKILGIDIAREGPNETVRIRANLAHPVEVAGRIIYPMGWRPNTAGWYQVNLTLGGFIQYSLLALIAMAAWPVRNARELAWRAGIGVPFIVLLPLIVAPSSILAELWGPIHDDLDPHSFWPLLAWSRFLMGGGGAVIALLLAMLAIRLARPKPGGV